MSPLSLQPYNPEEDRRQRIERSFKALGHYFRNEVVEIHVREAPSRIKEGRAPMSRVQDEWPSYKEMCRTKMKDAPPWRLKGRREYPKAEKAI